MLHEALGSVSAWRDFPERLAGRTGCGVFAYSREGHGRSQRLGERRSASYLHIEGEIVLPALIEQLALDAPVLFGHSDGASIALLCAGARPKLPRALVLEAPHVFVEDVTLAGIEQASAAYASSGLRERLGRHHDDADATFVAWTDVWLDPVFWSWNVESYLGRIRCPVLAIQGEGDTFGTRAQLDAISAGVEDCRIVLLPNCGHAPHRDQPERVLELVGAFVDEIG